MLPLLVFLFSTELSAESVHKYVRTAHGLRSTTYGYNEYFCGDIGKPRPCSKGEPTASGVPFNPTLSQAAVFAPTSLRLRAQYVWLRVKAGSCRRIHLVDKGSPRFIGQRGFDLSPGAVAALTNEVPTPTWSEKVYVCKPQPLCYNGVLQRGCSDEVFSFSFDS